MSVGTPQNGTQRCCQMITRCFDTVDHCKLAWLGISATRKFHWIFRQSESSTEYFRNQKVPLNISAIRKFHWMFRPGVHAGFSADWLSRADCVSHGLSQINLLVLNQKALRNVLTISHFLAQTAYDEFRTTVGGAVRLETHAGPWCYSRYSCRVSPSGQSWSQVRQSVKWVLPCNSLNSREGGRELHTPSPPSAGNAGIDPNPSRHLWVVNKHVLQTISVLFE